MDREAALTLCREKTLKDTTVRHLISVEGVMRALARRFGEDERVVNGVLAHAYARYRTDLMSRAVVHADAVAGLLVAAALVRPERAQGMKVSSLKKKLKERAFAPGVNRDEVYGVEEGIGLPLDEFVAVAIEGLQLVAPEIGLTPEG
jgi:predicted hydrolase (HD superfamily)